MNWVSGTDSTNYPCSTLAAWLYLLFKPAPSPGRGVKVQGQVGKLTAGSAAKVVAQLDEGLAAA